MNLLKKWTMRFVMLFLCIGFGLILSACDRGKKPYEEAEVLFNKSDYAAAKNKAVDVVQNAPKSKYLAQAKALYERIEKIENSLKAAGEAVRSSEYKAAIKSYEEVLVLDNKNQKAIKALQEVKEVYRNGLIEDAKLLYVDNGDYEKGIANYKDVLTYIPDDKEASEALQNAETTFATLRQIGDNTMEEFRIYIQTRGTRNYEAAEVARIRYLDGAKTICRIRGGRQYLALRLKEYQTEVETALNDFLSKGKAAQRAGSSDQRVLAADDYNRALASFVANYGRPEAWLESDARKALKDKDVSNWIPIDASRRDLFNAVYSGNINRVRTLITSGVDVNVKDEDGWTALMFAAQEGHLDIAKLLIDKGATVDAKNKVGRTALMMAKEGPVKIAHIKVKTEKEASDILKRLGNKEDFETLAKKYSVAPTASKGGYLGYLGRGTVVPEFEDAAFKLEKAGDISPIVSAGAGFHIIKLLEDKKNVDVKIIKLLGDKKNVDVKPFEKVKDTAK